MEEEMTDMEGEEGAVETIGTGGERGIVIIGVDLVIGGIGGGERAI